MKFVETIIKSILTKKENLFLFYMLSNSNLDLMLDYFKSLLASSHFDFEDLKKIINGVLITQQKMLETLLLYIYSEMNKENTFLMNLYDDSDMTGEFNNLFRVRLLQTIRNFGTVTEKNKIGLKYSRLRYLLDQFGYGNYAKKNLNTTIATKVDFSILETSIFGLDYRDDTDIILCDSAYYYVDHLIYTYRYMQTVIPDTRMDYRVDFLELKGNLKKIDNQINEFIKFIERCEKKERTVVSKTFKPAISEKMKQGFARDRTRQMSSGR